MNCQRLLFISFLLFSSLSTIAQKETYNWYFGRNAGINFSSGKPVALTDGALSTEEGCVSISDKNGKLLFYTDGITAWKADHQKLPYGDSLMGNPSSTQSGVVIPKPKSDNEFYLFTLASVGGSDGFRYSIVDMNANGGNGTVDPSRKNVLLHTPVTEKLTAVKHRNNIDTWVIAHGWNSNEFLSFLVSPTGISTKPFISAVGSVHSGGTVNTQGYMKANPDGTNLALALEDSNLFELFDFDNVTGLVSHPITMRLSNGAYPYGVEFSSDGSLLYGSAAGKGEIYQYNLQAGSPEKILASATIVGKSPEGKWVGALQIAADGKIYYPIYGTPYLGVIHEPNKLGMDCRVENNYVFLENKNSQLGLPGFDQSYFTQDQTKSVKYFDQTKVEIGKKLILNNINFDYAKYNLKAISFVELDQVVKILKTNPKLSIELLGHTDNIGNKSFNIELSKNRTESVKQYLVSKGIVPEKIAYEGFGSSRPIANNTSEAGRAKNRRVEFVFIEEK